MKHFLPPLMAIGLLVGGVASANAQNPWDPRPLASPVTVKLGVASKSELYGDAWLADALGEFKKENIEIEYFTQRPSDGLVLLTTGRIDMLASQPGSAFFNAVASGADIRVVAQNGLPLPDNKQGFWVNKAGLNGKPFTPAHLKGKVLATAGGAGDVLDYWLEQGLEKGGISLLDVQRKTLSVADCLPALENGAIDAAFLFDGFWQKGDFSKIEFGFGGAPDIGGAWIFGSNLLRTRRDVGEAVLRSMIRVRKMYLQGNYHDDPKVAPALAKTINLSVEQLRLAGGLNFSPDMPIPKYEADVLQKTYSMVRGHLTYTDPLPFDRAFDRSLAIAAGAAADPK